MQVRALALLLATIGVIALLASHQAVGDARPLLTAGGGVLVVLGALALLTPWLSPRSSQAFMRLDLFLPFLKKRRKNVAPGEDSPLSLLLQRTLPPSLLANKETGKPGVLRRLLKRLGPSVLSSPFRRIVQALCLLLFLALFFYVCWPYAAEPLPPPAEWTGWSLESFDQQTGEVRLRSGASSDWRPQPQEIVYLAGPADETAQQPNQHLGGYQIVRLEGELAALQPYDELALSALDQVLLGDGPWRLFQRAPDAWPAHYAEDLARKERPAPADLFLIIDPLVSLSTAVAARSWVWSLTSAGVILIVCIAVPRGFCGYLCPLGTLIDLFDWLIGRRVTRFRAPDDGWWVHLKYYLLFAVMISAGCGVLISGYVAAIPVVTRGALFLGEPLQSGLLRGWYHVPPPNVGHYVSVILFLVVLGLGLLKPRFWCKYVCPSGAVFSLGNLFRLSERKVESTCINCNKCVEICPFDAIKPDFTTRTTDCTLCQTCAGVCPTHAIKFVERWNLVDLKVEDDPPTGETPIGRRGFLSLAAGTAAAAAGGAAAAGAIRAFGARLGDPGAARPVRPPGSVPEQQFLQMCIRCGECFKACPNNVLQPLGFDQGWEGVWTPEVVADWAGCEASCNACGQVCPTGAIRALPLEEKKVARMGLAIVNPTTCLPMAGEQACQLCVDECHAAGYHAIEFTQVHTKTDEQGRPVEDSGFVAPVVLSDKCVGCGLCQTACYRGVVEKQGLLSGSAIVVEAGGDREDRLMNGSYRQLREDERRQRVNERPPEKPRPNAPATDADPFGLD